MHQYGGSILVDVTFWVFSSLPTSSLFIVSPFALMLVRPSRIIKREKFYAVYGALIKDFN